MQGNVFQFAFDTYNSTISAPVSEKYEKIDPDGYDNGREFSGCDVYKKLKSCVLFIKRALCHISLNFRRLNRGSLEMPLLKRSPHIQSKKPHDESCHTLHG